MPKTCATYLNRKSPQFICGVAKVAALLGIPDWRMLLAVMYFESCINAQARNKLTRATGLIQFMPSTAHNLGTTVEALYAMDDVQQLPYVYAYLKPYSGKLLTTEDLYMAVLWPRAVGKPLDYVLWRRGEKAYEQNQLDWNNDGVVTKAEAAKRVREIYEEMRS